MVFRPNRRLQPFPRIVLKAKKPGVASTQLGTSHQLKIGGGGYVTGVHSASDGTLYCRTDTYGFYRWQNTSWKQLINSTSMPTQFVGVDFNTGGFEIRSAPSAPNIVYMAYNGYLFKSLDRGEHWTLLANFSRVTAEAENGETKISGPFIWIDPINANVVFFGTPYAGCWLSSNGGTTWALVPDLGVVDGHGFIGAFDPHSSVSGGKTQGIYVAKYGVGVYHSEDGGANFDLMPGSPDTHNHIACNSNGRVFLSTQDSTGNLYFSDGGTWSFGTVGGNGNPLHAMAIDPADPNRVVACHVGGDIGISLDGGESFVDYSNNYSETSSNIPWMPWVQNNQPFMSAGDIVFSATVPNLLIMGAGLGVWQTNPDNDNAAVVWDERTVGIENLVGVMPLSVPDNKLMSAWWDRPFFRHDRLDAYPDEYLPGNEITILRGASLDYAPEDHNFIAGIDNWSGIGDYSGYSEDGGRTWTLFDDIPSDVIGTNKTGGNIAVFSKTKMMWFPSNGGVPYRTTDGGATWALMSFPGSPPDSGWNTAYFLDRHIVTVDKETPGTALCFNSGKGTYKTTNYGATWTLVSSVIPSGSGFHFKMRYVPGKAGHAFRCVGQFGNPGDANPETAAVLERTTDNGATWTTIDGFAEPYCFGFGAPKVPGGYPAIYVVGWMNGDYGIWQSIDEIATWRKIETFPLGSLDEIRDITGDINSYGRCIGVWNGSGGFYIDTADASIKPVIYDVVVDDNPDGGTITWKTDKPANSRIDYGTTSGYGHNVSSGTLSTSHSLQITGQTSSTILHYKLTSADNAGNSISTLDDTFLTTDITPPSKTTGLTATAQSQSKILLEHYAATDDIGVTGFRLFRNGVLIAIVAPGSSFTDSDLWRVTEYSYTALAFDAAGNYGALSDAVLETTQDGVSVRWLSVLDPKDGEFDTDHLTWTGVDFGPEAADRVVVALPVNAAGGSAGHGLTDVSYDIGGGDVSFSKEGTSGSTPGTDEDTISTWTKLIATGTTASVTVTGSASSLSVTGLAIGYVVGSDGAVPSDVTVHIHDGGTLPAVVDPQEIPKPGDDADGLTVDTNGAALIAWMSFNNTPQNVIWSVNVVGDLYKADTINTFVGISTSVGHSYEDGEQFYTVAGDGVSGFSFAGGAGIAIAFAPAP